MPLASLTPPFEGAVSRTLSDWNRAFPSLLVAFALQIFFFVLPCRLSLVVYSSSSSRGLLLPRRATLPLRLCLSRPSRSPSLGPSFSQAIALLFPPRPPSSSLPSHLPGFYLSLASTRSLSGNERRNTLATFNRPALSSAYTYLAGSVPPSLPTPSSSSPSSPLCHPRPSSVHPRQAPTSRFLLLIFTTNIVYKYLRALSLVFRAFCYVRLERPSFFPEKLNPTVKIRETSSDFGSTDLRHFYRLTVLRKHIKEK